MSQYICIYIGNHGKKDGIEDYLSVIQKILARKGIDCIISKEYKPGIPNIVIDEFTNYIENRKLAKFRKNNPDTPLTLVLTEFVQTSWGVKSLNHFGGISDSALISLVDILLLNKRKDLSSPGIQDWIKVALFTPVILTTGFIIGVQLLFLTFFSRARAVKTKSKLIDKFHQKMYWGLRYHGLMKNLSFFDSIISSHEKIWPQMIKNKAIKKQDQRYLGIIYPEFDINDVLANLFSNKEIKIEITGSITPYRIRWTNKINFQVLSYGLHNTIGMVEHIQWGMTSSKPRAAFSLHPPQTIRWSYSSPTRIYRALQVDGNLPIVTQHFGQSPIEDVCLVYDGVDTIVKMIEYWEDREAACNFIKKKISTYNAIVIQKNNIIMERILIPH